MATGARDGSIATDVAAVAIVIAMLSNTLVKLGLAWTLGAPALRRPLAVASGLLLAGSIAGLIWLR